MTRKSLMSARIGDVMAYARLRGVSYDTLRVVDAFPEVATRDTSRGGGKLNDEDAELLSNIIRSETTLEECLMTARGIVMPGRELEDVQICVVDEEDPFFFVAEKTSMLN